MIGVSGSTVGTIVGKLVDNIPTVHIGGGCSAQADIAPLGSGAAYASGVTYATVSGNVATFVDTLTTNTEYKVMMPVGEVNVFSFEAAGSWIAFDTNMVSFAGTVDVASGVVGVQIETTEANGVVRFAAVPFGAPKTEISPGDDAVVVSAESADEATNKVELVIEDQAAEAAGQATVVKLVATPVLGQENKWSVTVAIDEDAAGFVDPDVTVADVATNLATVAAAVGSTVSITIPVADVTPGLYYSVAMVTDLATADAAAWAAGEGARALAGAVHGEGVTLVVPKPESGTKAFYKVLVNMVGNTPAPVPNAGE